MFVPAVPRIAAFGLVASALAVLVAGCGLGIYGTEDLDAAGADAGLDGGADVVLDTTADTTIDTAPDVMADTGPVADAAEAGIPCTTSSACKSGNQCVTGTCNTSTGTCVFTNATADSVCSSYKGNQAGFCDGMGHCAQCTKSSECPGTTTNCEAPACTSNACTTDLTPSGTPTTTNPPQVAGDCQTIECNGSGGTMSVADDADTPPPKACQIPACTSGTPSYSNASNGTACGTGLACLGGACSGCTMNSQCQPPAYDTCGGGGTANTCGCTPTTCAALGDTCGTPSNGCGGTLPCNDGLKDGNETDVDCGGNLVTCTNRCAQGKKCNITADCASGLSCADGVCCNSACNTACEACTSAKKGQGADGVCGAVAAGHVDPRGICTSSGASTCGDEGSLCNGSGACETWPNGTVCQAATCMGATIVVKTETCVGGTCTSGGQTDCTPYKCAAGACTTTCNVDTDCASGSDYCNATHQCTLRLTQGTACVVGGSPTQCQSGFCVDGFCCNSACNTQCQACSNALTGGANGTCTSVNAGTVDPSGTCATQGPTSCGTDGLCAAGGACQDYASGTVCVAASCSMATNMQTTQGVCSGGGMCTGSTTTSCAPYVCGGTSCLTSCPSNTPAGDGSCATGNWCNGTACVAAQPSMSSCTRGSQCSSGICSGDAGMMTCN
jgi:hypothetical protein